MSDPDTKRIHFMPDVVDTGDGWRCTRCGETRRGKMNMYTHRKGIINHCLLKRAWAHVPIHVRP